MVEGERRSRPCQASIEIIHEIAATHLPDRDDERALADIRV